MEKHEHSGQLFIPMGGASARYLVVVAKGEDQPDTKTFQAFIANSEEVIYYPPGLWHLPMTVLGNDTLMASLICENGSEEDCQIFNLKDRDISIEVTL